MKIRILLVEDDPGVSLVVADLLRAEDYHVDTAADGDAGLKLASANPYDVLILDVMLPKLSGSEICHTVRSQGFDGAILMLTAKGQVTDRVKGLKEGADDYLVKPFDSDELIARVGSLLRRLHRKDLIPAAQIRFGKVEADFGKAKFTKSGKPLALTAKEVELLRLLVNQRGQTVSRDRILERVWPEQKHITARTVDVHIAWLRQKIEDKPDSPQHIVTVRGEGYRFEK